MSRILAIPLLIIITFLLISSSLQAQQVLMPEKVVTATYFDVTPPLRNMPLVEPGIRNRTWKNQIVKNHFGYMEDMNNLPIPSGPDLLLQDKQGSKSSRSINQNFEGVNNLNGVAPPDTDGDVGPNHYFQVVNLSFAIYSKEGTLLYGPADNKTIWEGFIGPWTGTNDGDPIVLYDEVANRWMMSQFAIYSSDGTQWELVAVSQTGDPTGVWYRYAFQFTYMPDYPKFGIWNDGYYLSVNQFEKVGSTYNWKGGGASVFNRNKMLAGDPSAEMVFFNLGVFYGGLLPADVDGNQAPAGTPGYFARISSNGLQMWSLTANWSNPPTSTLTMLPTIPVAAFSTSGITISQPGTTQDLTSITDRLMYRLQYRNFGNYQALVTNHTVNNGNGKAAIRWYELRKTSSNWSLYQQGTFAPADGNHRWMSCIAMNEVGDIALGYSVSGNSTYPSIRFTGRNVSDMPGVMSWDETSVYEGTQSQTSLSRWGDYSCMSVDPANDNDFWFTAEYSNGGWNWRTRIASFSPVPAPLPLIIVSPDSIDFGNVVPGNPSTKIITVQNTGNAQLVVDDVISDNQDFVVNPASLTVEPGGQAEIMVDFYPSSAGLKVGSIIISSNDLVNPELTVAVAGTGVLPAPENLKAEVNNHSVSLTWQAPQTSVKGFLGYNIYRQGNLINPEPVSGNEFTETNVPGGEWLYQVAAVFNEGLSELTPPVTVVVGKPQIWTSISSVSDTLISGDSLAHQMIVKNTGDLPLNFGIEVNFDFKNPGNPMAGFCIPGSNCNSGRRLDIFILAEINNTSSGCSPSGYGDFTYLTGNLEAGMIYTAGFKGGISKMYVCLWIDFNENEEFETDEILVNDLYLKYASETYTQEITLPTFVNSGQKRLRVRCNYNASAADPCSDFTNGETEDYTVELKGGQDAWLTINPPFANLLPGDSVVVDLKLNASRLEKAIYSARIGIASNDPDNSYFEIPVVMNVFYILAKFSAVNVNLLTGDSTNFNDYSLGNPTTWLWEFEGGNPSTSTDANPVGIKYMETGVFDVLLTVRNGMDTSYLIKQDLITVLPSEVLHADFISDFTVVDEGGAVHFFDNSTGNPNFYRWEIPGGNPEIIYIQNPIIIFNTPGFYDVTLYISGDSMSDEITKYDYIEVQEVVSTLPPGWDYNNTFYQHVLAVPSVSNPRIIDTPLNPGDYVGVFYTNSFGQKACAGATIWTGLDGAVVVAQGDDPFTPFKDGFAVGESFEWRLYSWSRERDFIAVPHYDPALLSNGLFYPMGMSALTDIYSGITFTLTIPQGWSGISLPVDPWYPGMGVLLEPVTENLVMLYNNSGLFWPENNINTLGNWNVLSGYVIKSLQPDTVVVEGYKEKNLIRGLAPGWNYLSIPVLCDNNVVALFASNLSKLGIIREIAGLNMYWPQFNINTLGTVKPGKAYHVYVNQAFNLQFSECTLAPQAPVSDDVEQISFPENPWDFAHLTGNIHSIAFSQSAMTEFVAGDVVGVFDVLGNCCGIAGFDGRPLAVNVFGDDATTPEKDGFLENENMVFKIYRAESREVFELFPVFDPDLQNNGAFITNGLSAITDFKLSLGVNSQISGTNITIFPNPADGKFKISGIASIEKIYVLDMQGREILQAGNHGQESLTIDFTENNPGIYFVKMVSKHEVFVKRIVLK